MVRVCTACGTSYDTSECPGDTCKICEDDRQFIPPTGQSWIAFEQLAASHTNKWFQHENGLLSISTVPDFAIGQRAFLFRTPEGNILWDCIACLDDATQTLIEALGGIQAIAISHPHYYTAMQDWAERFNAPVWLHTLDREWVVRKSPALKFWSGETLELAPNINLLRLGGHFPGGTILHSPPHGGVVLAGDIIQVAPGTDRVSFMWSYPNMLPLPASAVEYIATRVEGLQFDRLYGAFEGQDIKAGAKEIVIASSRNYLHCLSRQ